jgi:hypothetical protein
VSVKKRRGAARFLGTALLLGLGACVVKGDLSTDTFRLKVGLTLVDGSPLPGPDAPLCLDLRGVNKDCPDGLDFLLTVEAISLGPDGSAQRDTTYNRFARVSVLPGTVLTVQGDSSDGRNVRLENGYVENQRVHLVGTFGPTHLVVEDIGYQPGDPTRSDLKPKCADGIDNDLDGLTDFPADPGCAFSNDDTEEGGSFAAGVGPTLNYAYPTVAQIQGYGAGTPFAQEGVVVETEKSTVLVSRLSSNGFFVVDTDPVTRQKKPFGGLFVFNFGVPAGVRICDRVTYLSGTMDEFFGYTEMNFPSYDVHPWNFADVAAGGDGPCLLPEPHEILPAEAQNNAIMEDLEASLVRITGAHVAANFGSSPPAALPFDLSPAAPCQGAKKFVFSPGASNCDFDNSGSLNFAEGSDEGLCACFCYQDPECSEWSAFQGRGNFRMVLGGLPSETIQANTGQVPTFSPRVSAGKTIKALTGTVANFSGGDLNWTIEARCEDDLIICPDEEPGCALEPLSSQKACVRPRTASDNDSASN